MPTRFRKINAEDGAYFLDSSDLFEINPDISKPVADTDFGDAFNGQVQRDWILLSRSGQIYGLNGPAMITGHYHEDKVRSDHVIRIAPDKPKCRIGYLLVAMTHPSLERHTLGRPLRSGIPEIEVLDVQQFAIPRLDQESGGKIADCAEEAARLRDEADEIEIQIGNLADSVLQSFLASKSQ